MTPLERAARTLCEMAGNPPGAPINGKPLWMDYLPEVRAVIEAIREPSEDMKLSGNAAASAWDVEAVAHKVWPAMIDALLAEGGKSCDHKFLNGAAICSKCGIARERVA